MTKPQFVALCERYAVAPSVALESEDLREALAQRNFALSEIWGYVAP